MTSSSNNTNSIFDPEYTFITLGDEIGIDYRIRKALARLGHIRPTLVQTKCFQLAIRSGRDLVVRARTGSGKTLAYCIPILHKILIAKSTITTTTDDSNNNNNGAHNNGVRAIIIVPTRELCNQVQQQIQSLIYYCYDIVSSAVLSISARKGKGSSSSNIINKADQAEYDRQEAMLRDYPDILVTTPGGLLTHIRNGNLINLSTTVETLVIDEADLVLSFGNSNDDMTEIVKNLPRIYQGFLMSATLSPELETLKKVVLHNPITLRLEQDDDNNGNGTSISSSSNLKQFYIALPKRDRNLVVYVFLKLGLLKGKGIFFVNTIDTGYRLKLFLEQFHIRSSVLNSELPFKSRINIIEQFNLGNFDYLIATDTSADAAAAAAGGTVGNKNSKQGGNNNSNSDIDYGVVRGMDFYKVLFVVNYDIPPNPQSYAHRIGRTARGGAKGVAVTFIDSNNDVEHTLLEAIQESQPKIAFSDASTPILQASNTEYLQQTNGTEATTASSTMDGQRQPVPLDFDLQEIEGFRYRVEDVQRAVTKTAVRETRAAEIKAELLNSEKLQSHFEENPADLQLLAHDRIATHVSNVQPHLKHVANYLLPRGMQDARLNNNKKRKKKQFNHRDRKMMAAASSNSMNDPLRNYNGNNITLDGVDGVEEGGGDNNNDDDEMPDFWNGDDDDDDNDNTPSYQKNKNKSSSSNDDDRRIFANTKDGTGRSTSGRKEWKMKHGKGEFSNKKRKTNNKYKEPLGF